MIFDNIKNCKMYFSVNENFEKAFECSDFLKPELLINMYCSDVVASDFKRDDFRLCGILCEIKYAVEKSGSDAAVPVFLKNRNSQFASM